jgi:RNA-binding protein
MSASPTSSLSSSARRALRAAAHHLDPVVMMGQHGLTPAVLHEIDLALTAHALIKVRAGSDERDIRDGFLAEICEKLSCESVQHLGKLFVLWRNADGAGNADKSAEQDAAAVKASNDPHAAKERGPRSKLPSERAAERANAAPAGRSAGYSAGRGGPPSGGRGAPRGVPSGGRDATAGPRWKYGETPPDAPRREGWAPKDRRGAARFGEGGDDSRRRDSGDDTRRRDSGSGYGAPRGRAPTTGGGGYAGSSGSTGGGEGYRGAAPSGGRSGYGGGGNYGNDNRGGAGGGSSYGGRGGSGSYGGGQGDGGAPRARWGERREPSQGGGGYAGGGNSGGGSGFGNNGNDRAAPAPRSTYSRGNDAGGSDRAPRTGGGGGWGNRDGVTGKPSGFSRGGTGGGAGGSAGGASPRARRRFG